MTDGRQRDPHHAFAEWLEDASGHPLPRVVAVHAALCDDCRAIAAAYDALAAADVSLAGFPPQEIPIKPRPG